jgi:hypothetical protein
LLLLMPMLLLEPRRRDPDARGTRKMLRDWFFFFFFEAIPTEDLPLASSFFLPAFFLVALAPSIGTSFNVLAGAVLKIELLDD